MERYAGYRLTPRDQDVVGISLFGRVKMPTSFEFPYTDAAPSGPQPPPSVSLPLYISALTSPAGRSVPHSSFWGISTLQTPSHEALLSKKGHREWLLEAIHGEESEYGGRRESYARGPDEGG